MEQIIYTYGGGEVLWKIFNVLAMIFKSDSLYFTPLLKVTVAIGAIWAAMRAICQANLGLFAKSWFIPTYIILSLFLVPKVSVHIIDRVDTSMHYAKVDHIPLGLSCVASLASRISDSMALYIDQMIATNDSERYTVVGPVFGARLAKAVHDIKIKNPIMKENMKDFVSRCFMWPFVFTNMSLGRLSALQSKDILNFVKTNPHPWLGMYWREQTGETTFLKCDACAVKVEALMKIEVPLSISDLAHDVFGVSYNPSEPKDSSETVGTHGTRINSKLLLHFGDAWQHIARSSENLAKVVEQEMMINSYRESLDDSREKFGLDRLDPGLLAYSAERMRAQQNTSFFVKMLVSGRHVPILQTVFSCLIFMLFIIVAPCVFLPGGFKLLSMWVKLTLWVNSWPLFYSLINGLGHLFMMKSAAGIAASYGEGLTLLTQGGISEVAYDAYAFTMGLQLSVPFISWAMISSSGYAITQVASSLTQGLESQATRLGSDMTDGNLSVGNQNLHTQSLSTSQIAQQSLGANHNFSKTINDGVVQMTYGDQGRVTGQAYMSQLPTSISSQDNWAATASDSYQKSTQLAGSSMLSLAQRLSEGKGITENMSQQESADTRQSAENFLKSIHDYAKQHNMSENAAADMAFKVGGNFIISGHTGNSASASNNESIQKALSSGTGQQMVKNASKLLNYSKQHGTSLNDSSARETAETLNRQVTTSQNWQKLAQFAETNSLSIGRNENDAVLQSVADTRFNGDKTKAIQFAVQKPHAYAAETAGYVSQRQEALKGMVSQANHVLSDTEIQDFMKEPLKLSPVSSPQQTAFEKTYADRNNEILEGYEQGVAKTEAPLKDLENKFHENQHEFTTQEGDGNIVRMLKKFHNNALPSGTKNPTESVENTGYASSQVSSSSNPLHSFLTFNQPSNVTEGQGIHSAAPITNPSSLSPEMLVSGSSSMPSIINPSNFLSSLNQTSSVSSLLQNSESNNGLGVNLKHQLVKTNESLDDLNRRVESQNKDKPNEAFQNLESRRPKKK